MDAMRTIFLLLAAGLIVVGSIAILALEFTSAQTRRLGSQVRDTLEVLLPPVLLAVLLWLVWLDWM